MGTCFLGLSSLGSSRLREHVEQQGEPQGASNLTALCPLLPKLGALALLTKLPVPRSGASLLPREE